MSLREALNQRKALGICIALASVLLAGGYLAVSLSNEDTSGHDALAWYTIDDGKTWFADKAANLPPFQKDGKTAYGCVVWTLDGGKTKQVSHLYRYSEQTRRRMLEFAGKSRDQSPLALLSMEPMEVKKPGTGDIGWVKATDPLGIEIQSAISAEAAGSAIAVMPE